MIAADAARKGVRALSRLLDDTAAYLAVRGPEPTSASLAMREMGESAAPKKVEAAWMLSGMLIEVAADHVMALIRTLTEPVQTIAPWVCARAVLESAALVCWLADAAIDPNERIARSLAWRCKGLDEQRKFANAASDAESAAKIECLIRRRKAEADELGCGLAQLPNFVELIGTQLDMEKEYRLFSSLVHPHSWALQQVAFLRSGPIPDPEHGQRDAGHHLEKGMKTEVAAYLCVTVAEPFAKALSAHCALLGHDLAGLVEALRPARDELHSLGS